MIRATLAGSAALALAAASPAAAAPAIATDQPCYIGGQQQMAISGTGFTPGAGWSVETDQVFEFGTVDPMGAFTGTATAPSLGSMIGPGSKTFTLTAKQDQAPVATTQFRVTNFAAAVSPRSGRPTATGTWSFSGFTPGKSVYVHVRRAKKTVGNYRFGRAAAPCGTLKARAKRLPIKRSRIRSGAYQLYFDAKPTFSAGTRPQLRATTTVFLTGS